jgi:hypothetical protein
VNERHASSQARAASLLYSLSGGQAAFGYLLWRTVTIGFGDTKMTKQEEQIILKARDLVRKVWEIPEDREVYQREDEIVLAKQAIRAEMQVAALTHALNPVASRKLDDGPCFCGEPYSQTVHAHTPWYLIAREALSNNARQ